MANKTNTTTKKTTVKGILENMYPALVKAHNDGNRKAIDRQRCADLEIEPATLATWELKVKELQAVCLEYVEMRHNSTVPGHEVEEGELYAARQRIYPKWKDVLSGGNAKETPQFKKLRCRESDVEILTEFAWTFFAPNSVTYTKGTQVAPQTAYNFRKMVESHLGCRIAENVMLTDKQRETLSAYHSAQVAKTNASDAIVSANDKIAQWDELLEATPDTPENKVIRDYLTDQRAAAVSKKKDAEESQQNAEMNIKKFSTEAMNIEKNIKIAKIK